MTATLAILKPFWRNRLSRTGIIILGLLIFVALFAHFIAPYSPNNSSFPPMLGPSAQHWLGTTQGGQDVFSQLVYGSRQSLYVGFAAGTVATIIALIVGLVSGYAAGFVDDVLSYFINVFLVIPGLPLMIILAAYAPVHGSLLIIFVIAVTGWAWGARVLRSQVTTLRSRDYVAAARFAGDSMLRIIFPEIMPNMISLVAAGFLGAAVSAILGAAGLEFLGLGDPSINSWGTMLYWAENSGALLQGQWAWLFAPGFLIAALGTALVLINFAVDEMANPRLRKKG